MRTITEKEIRDMFNKRLLENLKAVVGKGKDKKVVLAPGLKIKHNKSGFVYTLRSIIFDGQSPSIEAESGDGETIVINQSELKNYV